MADPSKVDKWKQLHDATLAIQKHWRERHKAKDAINKSFHARWHPKLQAILLPLDKEVSDELPDELVTGKAPDG